MPVCFKPVFSSGSRGFRILDPTVDRAHQLLNERPGSVAMRLEEAVELLPAEGGPDLLVMELATGGERTIDGIADGERILLGHPKTREAMRAGLAMYFVTLEDEALMEVADRIVAELEIEHFFNIQLVGRLRDRDQPAHLDRRLPGGSQHPVSRREAGARGDLGRRARGAAVADQARPDGAALLRPARVGRLTRAAPVDARPLLPHPEPPPTRGHGHGAMPGVTCQCRDRAGWVPVSPPMSSADARTQNRSATPRPLEARRRRPQSAADARTAELRRPPHAEPTGRPLRVTLCPVNTAGVPWATAEALRRRGVDARLVVFERYALHPEADVSLDRSGGFARRQAAQWRALAKLLPQTDVFHFVFGLTLVPRSLQFPALRLFGKKSVMHYLGSDIRGKTPEQLAYGKKAGAEIVGSYDAVRWVPEAEVLPPGIDVSRIAPSPPSDRTRPVILHAPSSRRRKGTEHVIAAVEGLDADLEIVEGLHHDEAFERFRNADIVVDQLNAGWYGLFAIECMALGKPVVTYLHDEAVRRTEEAFGTTVPIVSATAETLREQLRPLVDDAAERRRRGAASRAYVELVHDQERITDRLLDVYARL